MNLAPGLLCVNRLFLSWPGSLVQFEADSLGQILKSAAPQSTGWSVLQLFPKSSELNIPSPSEPEVSQGEPLGAEFV